MVVRDAGMANSPSLMGQLLDNHTIVANLIATAL
jgi:hypothetical protein